MPPPADSSTSAREWPRGSAHGAASPLGEAQTTRSMVLMGVMMSAGSTIDLLTTTVLPITARHFTDNLTLVGLMVAMNRICGFVFQPYAAWRSDRGAPGAGPRRRFLLRALPAALIGIVLLGLMPWLVPPDHHRAFMVVGAFFLANLLMQAAADLCYGAGDPLYGDMFSPGGIGRATGLRMVITAAVGVAMTQVFIPLGDSGEFWPYGGAIAVLVLAMAAAWGLPSVGCARPLAPGERYRPLAPLAELRDPRVRRTAVCASAALGVLALTEMLHALFVTETLGFSWTVLGTTTTAASVVSVLMSYPVGWLVDRWGARRVAVAGFILVAGVEAAFVCWVHDLASLVITVVLFKASWVVLHLPMLPLVFHDVPAERRGAQFAAIQMTRAAAASAVVLLASGLAHLTESYRICYLLAGATAVIGLISTLRLQPGRIERRVPALA